MLVFRMQPYNTVIFHMAQWDFSCFSAVQEEANAGKLESLRDSDAAAESGDQSLDSSAKKKRNSYADSPHKLRCPYCTRAFPWISSLKRHILTHTGPHVGLELFYLCVRLICNALSEICRQNHSLIAQIL